MKKYLLLGTALVALINTYGQPRNPAKPNGPVVTKPLDPSARGNNQTSSGQMNKVPLAVVGKYEAYRQLADKTIITQGYDMNNGSNEKVKVTTGLNGRDIVPQAASGKIKKFVKPGSTKSKTTELENGWEDCETETSMLSVFNLGETTINYSDQVSRIYPGAVFSAPSFLKGEWNDINNDRNPLTLITSVKNTGREKPSKKIEAPDRASISNAVNEMYNSFTTDEKKIAAEQFNFTLYEVENEASFALKVGASGHYIGYSAEAMLKTEDKSKFKYILIDATKIMFNINVMPDAAGIMKNPTTDLMYISQVNYGARIIAVAKIQTYSNTTQVGAAVSANYLVAGGSFTLDNLSSQLGSVSEIKYYVVGGRSDAISTVYSVNDLKSACQNIMTTMNYHVAQPISYVFSNMNNKQVKRYSATDYFISNDCTFRSKNIAGVPNDLVIKASIMGISPNVFTQDDLDIYGQVWVQAFDGAGKEVLPVGGNSKDRLMDLPVNQRLKPIEVQNVYAPKKTAEFRLNAEVAKGAKLIIYFWFMDWDEASGDDFLRMRNGNNELRTYNRNNEKYYSAVIDARNAKSFNGINSPEYVFVDQDGENGIKVRLQIDWKE